MKAYAALMQELSSIRKDFETKNRREPTAEEIRILSLAEKLLRERAEAE